MRNWTKSQNMDESEVAGYVLFSFDMLKLGSHVRTSMYQAYSGVQARGNTRSYKGFKKYHYRVISE